MSFSSRHNRDAAGAGGAARRQHQPQAAMQGDVLSTECHQLVVGAVAERWRHRAERVGAGRQRPPSHRLPGPERDVTGGLAGDRPAPSQRQRHLHLQGTERVQQRERGRHTSDGAREATDQDRSCRGADAPIVEALLAHYRVW